MADKKNNRMLGVGVSSVLVIFATLALAALALLSVYTSAAGQTLSENACASVENYYGAQLEANRILARLRSGEAVEGVTEDGGVFTYAVAIDDRQRLQVSVAVDGAEYRILRWQAESRFVWEADDRIHVFEMKN